LADVLAVPDLVAGRRERRGVWRLDILWWWLPGTLVVVGADDT
jgi:hypothetical protein